MISKSFVAISDWQIRTNIHTHIYSISKLKLLSWSFIKTHDVSALNTSYGADLQTGLPILALWHQQTPGRWRSAVTQICSLALLSRNWRKGKECEEHGWLSYLYWFCFSFYYRYKSTDHKKIKRKMERKKRKEGEKENEKRSITVIIMIILLWF